MQTDEDLARLIDLLDVSFKGKTFNGYDVEIAIKALEQLYKTGEISPEYYNDTIFSLSAVSSILKGHVFAGCNPSKTIAKVISELNNIEA